MSVTDRVIVVTGASGGLGRVVARRLAVEGARPALVGSHRGPLETLAAELALPADRLLVHAGDLREPVAARATVAAVKGHFGRVDALIHLVGGWAGGTPVPAVAAETMDQMLQQHLWTTFYLMQAFVPPLLAQGWGRVIAVSSPFASRPQANGAPYAVGKAAQEALFLTLAEEVKDTGVTANLLLVRSIDTEHARDRSRTPQNAAWTTPEEITATILHLCSAEAGAINGARIPLYGRL